MARSELLAPAGQPDAGYAALHYGADAVYLGLAEFSARAEAVNFTPAELEVFTGYAHSLTPRRKVYLTLNTLIKEDETSRAADTMLTAIQCSVDALIIQDLGLARLARENFPNLELHASTQMAIHNLEGANLARELGFRRVTLARELTLPEITVICRDGGVEVETFVHGTLCYSYSGLCLFSSIATGRSGNRGRCVYTCREAADTPAGHLHPFSLKDMALGEQVLDLARAGVASFKIEGRKKSPLYVAATVDYYRRILDGTMKPEEREEYEARLQTIFARPWTTFFLNSRRNAGAADTNVVGHRGARIGEVERLVRTPAGPGIGFRSSRALERHDGLQIDLPGSARPYGFAVDNLYLLKKGRTESAFAAPARTEVAVALPEDAPTLSPGLPVYQSSSQEVKRSYPFAKPRSDTPEPVLNMDIAVNLTRVGGDGDQCRLVCTALAPFPSVLWGQERQAPMLSTLTEMLPAFSARDAAGSEKAAFDAFKRTGGSRFRLSGWLFANPDELYVRPGEWNRLRRELLANLDAIFRERVEERRNEVQAYCIADPETTPVDPPSPAWSLFIESPGQLAAFTDRELADLDEVLLPHDADPRLLDALAERTGRGRIRLATPLIVRENTMADLADRIGALRRAGWNRWLLGGLGMLALFIDLTDNGAERPDLTADWPLYVTNHLAAAQLRQLGFAAFTLSPEDDAVNMHSLLRTYPAESHVVVYSDLPLFISAACAHNHLGLCTGLKKNVCRHVAANADNLEITMEKSGRVAIAPQSCGSIVTGDTPYSLVRKVNQLRDMGARKLRIDLRWRRRTPGETLDLWRRIRNGSLEGGTEGNFSRGLQ